MSKNDLTNMFYLCYNSIRIIEGEKNEKYPFQ